MVSLPIIKGYRLQPNQTVGIIAPASPVNQSEISEGLKLLESFPLTIKQGEHIFDHLNYLAGSDNDRVSDLHQMFSDPEIKAIFCTRGGYGSARLLDKIDFDLIRKNPKIIVGFSDLELQGHNTKLFMAPCFSTALSVRSFFSEVVFLTTPQAYQ